MTSGVVISIEQPCGTIFPDKTITDTLSGHQRQLIITMMAICMANGGTIRIPEEAVERLKPEMKLMATMDADTREIIISVK